MPTVTQLMQRMQQILQDPAYPNDQLTQELQQIISKLQQMGAVIAALIGMQP
jgi:threonine aldolase